MTASAQPNYNFRENEPKRQAQWRAAKADSAPEAQADEKTCYVLEMFPYPSGNIHMGHLRNYAIGDVIARCRRMQGYAVLHPIGWDAFGLPAENAAIERGAHPGEWTYANIENMRKQLQSIGLSYDYDREFATCSADYYKEEQRFFLKFLEAGIAYRKEATVNWDPVDQTVLANEQVIEGRGWRSGALVEQKKLQQWFLKITDFAEDLLQGIDTLEEWPESVRAMQRNWIGKSEGALIDFAVENGEPGETLRVYSTRPETLFGAAFMAVSCEHPLAERAAASSPEAQAFIEKCRTIGGTEEALETAEKEGFDTGFRAVHPFDDSVTLPVYIANFVLAGYGEGALFGCPAHDERDFAFATKYNLPITRVVAPKSEEDNKAAPQEAYTGDGVMISSGFLNGLSVAEAKKAAIAKLAENGCGERKTQYRLRDWGISRQRYWGAPIPVIHCDSCGVVPVPEDQLPVTLPEDVVFKETGGNPLEQHPTWKHVDCPVCGKKARRETDTFDTFFESSWYFLRFACPGFGELDKEDINRWLPVDRYIGGVEHAVLHLLYARFFTRALAHIGVCDVKEPFKGLLTQGMVCHRTFKDSAGKWRFPDEALRRGENDYVLAETGEALTVGPSIKMSKSKKNVVDPVGIVEQYGADTARLFMLSDSPPERDLEWSDEGIEGAWRFVNKFRRDIGAFADTYPHTNNTGEYGARDNLSNAARALLCETHKTVAAVTDDIDAYRLNKAVARLRECHNTIREIKAEALAADTTLQTAMREAYHTLTLLFAPFIPHLAEDAHEALGGAGSVFSLAWPKADPVFLQQDTVSYAVQVNGKLRRVIEAPADTAKDDLEKMALAEELVQKAVGDKQVRKIIVVPGKIINVVAA